jgi:PDZ domain-containing protein
VSSPSEPPAEPAPTRRRRRRVLPLVASLLGGLLAAAAVAAAVIHVPYVIESPGSATPVDTRVVSVAGVPTFRHAGRVFYLTVRVSTSDPNLYRYLFASLSSSDSVVGKKDVLGCASYAADARLNTLLMRDSQDAATEVALRRLGYRVTHAGDEALIIDLACGGPSDHRLQVGDVVTAVDGRPVSSAGDVQRAVKARPAHAVVAVTVRRGDQTVTVSVRSGRAGSTAFLGIVTQTLSMWRFPIDVKIDTQQVGGPSAGLAFTLALINDLSSGDVTGGRRVAATGAIFADGTVGPVGGITQKVITAKRDHATALLVPSAEAKDARAQAGGLQIVPVRTIDEALTALRRLGGADVTAGSPLGPSAAQ